MAIYPGASWRPLPENETEPAIAATQLIFHSAVSRGESLYAFFSRADVVVESHFYVQGDGDAEQYIDTARQADANYRANVRAISVETWDNADPDRIPWTEQQMARLTDIAVWAYHQHGIPLRWCDGPDAPGIGYHSLFPGWSPVVKTCPGLARRPQVQQIINRAVAAVTGNVAPAPAGPVPVPAPEKKQGLTAPPFPLPPGWYFGPRSGPRQSVSGYFGYREALAYWQRRMKERGWQIGFDGLYGPETAGVARAFQAEKGLVIDGLIGRATWSAAWTAPVT